MPVNDVDIVVFDFETYGLNPPESPEHLDADPTTCEPIQVAGKAYNARTLEPYPADQGGEFVSMMRPRHTDRLDTDSAKQALAVNKKTREQVLAAPDSGVVWNQFVRWVGRWNKGGGSKTAPIPAGKNIVRFDLLFLPTLNALYCDKKRKTVLFHDRRFLDLDHMLFEWFESDGELRDQRMDTVRKYFGMSADGAHDALVDCRQTGALVTRFLKVNRELRRRKANDGSDLLPFRGAFANAS